MTQLTANAFLLIGGIGVLYFGAEWLVRGSARLAASLGVTPIVIGLTVVSIGTSAPELVVGLVAALRGNSDLVMGNVMGSNLANVGLILGLTAMVRPLAVTGRVVRREIPIMVGITLLMFPLVMDGVLNWTDGVLLLVVLGLYLLFVNRAAGEESPEVLIAFRAAYPEEADLTRRSVHLKDVGLIVGGSAGLLLGGKVIVGAAEFIAVALKVPDLTIGLTVVAIGTSLPELATALVAAARNEADIAVGNIIGSNIFNLAAILGVVSVVTPLTVTRSVLVEELPAVLIMSLLAFPITRAAHQIRRWEGAILLAAYAGALTWLVST